ncbi:YtxH domain-containing protein [Bacillus sp. EAC]|uniref:YtxH domain-containing protein n=1 Tax=Bacillus sp. EAC TaxID=1978338 RepID=UPI000B451EA0|nr:YtxH domain-containing protein [Bacillus sp. EAC]
MKKRNKALRNILVGVAIGAGVTLLNKENREKITRKGKSVTDKLNQMKEDPELVKGAVRSQLRVVQNSVEKLESNVQLVKDKWIEIKDSTKNKFESVKGTSIVAETADSVEEKIEDSIDLEEGKSQISATSLEVNTSEKSETDEQLEASLEGIEELTDENADDVEEKVESILLAGTTSKE